MGAVETLDLRVITEEYLGALSFVKEIPREISLPDAPTDIFCLVGPRRVGKSFLMLKKAKSLLSRKQQAIYVSMDEPLLREVEARALAELVRKAYPSGRVHLFLDEVQEWEGWDVKLRWLHDVKDFHLYVSGSSSALLSSEIPTRLRGRYQSKLVLPLSFREVAKGRGKTFREGGKLLNLFQRYMQWGGFPEVFATGSREKLIAIVETAFYRDVVERLRVRSLELFKDFFYYILSLYANPFTYNGLRKALRAKGMELDVKTIARYIEAVEDAFIIFTVPRFTYSEKEKLVSYKKLYLVDHAIANLFSSPLSFGRRVENIVFLELKRRYGEVYYYKTGDGQEVDFYVPSAKLLVEVSVEPSQEHWAKLEKAKEELGAKALLVAHECSDEPCTPLLEFLAAPQGKRGRP